MWVGKHSKAAISIFKYADPAWLLFLLLLLMIRAAAADAAAAAACRLASSPRPQ
jgi:hypothetical protein